MTDALRQHPRFVTSTEVEVRVGADEFRVLWTQNVSKGGLFVKTETPPAIGTKLEVRITTPSGVLAFQAEVVHIVNTATAKQVGHPPGAGLRFFDIPEKARAAIERYVEIIAKKAETTATEAAAASKVAIVPTERWVLGIDLGTMNTAAVAFGPSDTQPVSLFRGQRGRGPVLPSVVSYRDLHRPTVGWAAKDLMISDPATTVWGWKRFIGRNERNEFVGRHRDHFPFPVTTDPRGEIGAQIGQEIRSFVDVAAEILRQVKTQARVIAQTDVEDCVISVPAHFASAQRRAIKRAGDRAGLNVMKIVNEPTVSALSFGVDRGINSRVLIYDFGGGSFDATLLEVMDNVFDAKATSGDAFLGGIDLDRAVMDHLVEVARAKHRVDILEDPLVAQQTLNAAESAKTALTEQAVASVLVPGIAFDRRGNEVHLEYDLNRAELESLTAPLVERTIGIVEEMLAQSGYKKSDIDMTILVGGQSRMPLVQQRMEHILDQPPVLHPDGDPAVAKGAALVAKSIDDLAAAVLLDTLSVPIGMMIPGGATQWLFQKGQSLPATAQVPMQGQAQSAVALWEGTDLTATDRQTLGMIQLPPATEGTLVVTLSEDLELTARFEAPSGAVPLALRE